MDSSHMRNVNVLRNKVEGCEISGVMFLKSGMDIIIRRMTHKQKLLTDELLLSLCENTITLCHDIHKHMYDHISPKYIMAKPSPCRNYTLFLNLRQ